MRTKNIKPISPEVKLYRTILKIHDLLRDLQITSNSLADVVRKASKDFDRETSTKEFFIKK